MAAYTLSPTRTRATPQLVQTLLLAFCTAVLAVQNHAAPAALAAHLEAKLMPAAVSDSYPSAAGGAGAYTPSAPTALTLPDRTGWTNP